MWTLPAWRHLRVTILAGAAAVVFGAGLFVPSAAAVSGELRVLYVLATWGPTPFSLAEAERVAVETDAFFHGSSSGRLSLRSSVAGSLELPRPVFDSCDATVLRNAAPASTFTQADRVVFVTPRVPTCPFAGEANPTEVLLNGQLFMAIAAHELGHTLGLGHASRWDCAGNACTVDEYGGGFSVMGGGNGDFNAHEKAELQWLTGVIRPRTSAVHEIGPVDGPTTLPQALIVTTAASEYWFESRGQATRSFVGASEQPAGVAVLAGPANEVVTSPYPHRNLLLPNPGGRGRHAYVEGESFVQPGVFQVSVMRHSKESAVLGFEWLDRVPPGPARLAASATRAGRARLAWDPANEGGSGVDTYTVIVDGRIVRSVDGHIPYLNSIATLRLSRGLHRVGVFATDRAGNRGRTTSARVRVR